MKNKESNIEVCSYVCVHEDKVKKAENNMPSEETLFDLSDLFKVFGDKTRIKILYALYQSEMCVCDIAEVVKISQSAVSHQLKTLRQSKLVKYRKEGKVVYYSLDDEHVVKILSMGLEHIVED